MSRYRFILIVFVVMLSACATHTRLDPAMKSKLVDGIEISSQVKLSERPFYWGPEITWGGALGGAIGGGLAALAVNEPEKIKSYMEAENIDLKQLVLDELKHQISERPDLAGKMREGGKYKMELEIPVYGIAQKHGFSSEYKPTLGIKAKLVAPEGKIIWEYYYSIANLNSETPAFKFNDYFKTPDTFKAAYSSAAKVVIKHILDDLK
ncbi:MAG TPA: hypothetical protein PKD35_10800 [Nitrosomonas sp.]|nr:hypothetical protein [Nitrosomonas sp.]